MAKITDFTTGKILGPLFRFAMPVLFAMFLQGLYGAGDRLNHGRYADCRDQYCDI